MEELIAKLLQDFEQGKMSRRQLIQTLALTATTTAAMSAEPVLPAAGPVLKAVQMNHVFIEVADYTKIRDFYVDLFGMKVWGDNGQQCHLMCGESYITPRNISAGSESTSTIPRDNLPANQVRVEHIAIGIEKYDKPLLEAAINSRGVKAVWGKGGGVHVYDPEGFHVQITPKDQLDK